MTVKEERYHLFKHLLPNIHGAMHPIARFDPVDFACSDVPLYRLRAVPELDLQQISTQDDRDPMKWIAVPR